MRTRWATARLHFDTTPNPTPVNAHQVHLAKTPFHLSQDAFLSEAYRYASHKQRGEQLS